jgi:hypothetical protein
MMSEREGYSKENETLRQYRVAFQQLQEDNEALKRELEELKLPLSELAGIKMPTRYRVICLLIWAFLLVATSYQTQHNLFVKGLSYGTT